MAGEVCPHDKLRRNCDVCDLEAENTALRKRVEELEGAIRDAIKFLALGAMEGEK